MGICGKEMVLACWDFFSFLITYLQVQKRRLLKFGTSHDDLTNKEITAVNRWLPKPSRHLREIDLASFYGEEPTLKLMAKYEKFSTIDLTSSKKARRVIEDNGIDQENPNIRLASCERVRESRKCWIWDKYRNQPPRAEENPRGKKRLRVKWLLSLHGNSGWCRTVFVFLYTFAHRRPMLRLWDDHPAK